MGWLGVVKSLGTVMYRKPTRPTTPRPVLLRKSKDKKYQPVDPMGALLKIPCQDCVQAKSQLGAPLEGHDISYQLLPWYLAPLGYDLDTSGLDTRIRNWQLMS